MKRLVSIHARRIRRFQGSLITTLISAPILGMIAHGGFQHSALQLGGFILSLILTVGGAFTTVGTLMAMEENADDRHQYEIELREANEECEECIALRTEKDELTKALIAYKVD